MKKLGDTKDGFLTPEVDNDGEAGYNSSYMSSSMEQWNRGDKVEDPILDLPVFPEECEYVDGAEADIETLPTLRDGIKENRDELAQEFRARRAVRDATRQMAQGAKDLGDTESEERLNKRADQEDRVARIFLPASKRMLGSRNVEMAGSTPYKSVILPIEMLKEAVSNRDRNKIDEITASLSRGSLKKVLTSSYRNRYSHKLIGEEVFETLEYLEGAIFRAKNSEGKPGYMHNLYDPDYYDAVHFFRKTFEGLAGSNPEIFDEYKDKLLTILPMLVREGYSKAQSLDGESPEEMYPEAAKMYALIEKSLTVPEDFDLDASSSWSVDAAMRVNALLETGSEKSKAALREMIREYVMDPSLPTDLPTNSLDIEKISERCKICGLFTLQHEIQRALIGPIRERFKISEAHASEMIVSWEGVGGMKIVGNMEIMNEIEASCEGGVKLLREKYGICEFNRYPASMLIEQVRNHDKDMPYGIIMNAKDDHNDAFDNDWATYHSLEQQLDGKYVTRVFEVANSVQIMRVLAMLRKSYPDHKIGYLIFGGHGNKDSIRLGGAQANEFTLEGLDKSTSTSSIKDMFDTEASIVLNSCSTGEAGGIAEALSGKISMAQGPQIPTSIQIIDVKFIDDRPVLRATYAPPVKKMGETEYGMTIYEPEEGYGESGSRTVGATYKGGKRID